MDKKSSIGQLESKLQSVNQEIDSLTPNLRALDKLEGAESRLKAAMDSFEKQRVDAKKARDAFVKVKQQRYNQFAPCFRHISEQIDRVYKALVGDSGTAYLSLEDVEEPYLEGVRFHAMPPGKRFMDMDALSGGEKTMAALALLFTLHTFKPAPFFILDEVDAALDNQNVQRLAQYLHKQRGNVQLIVISLKHRLYEQADALIGVYRTGAISKPLTLRLTDYDSGDFKDEAEKENLAV